MTKERRLAIQMWEEIRAHIRDAKRIKDVDTKFITSIKRRFMEEHSLNWLCGCWFCAYVRYSTEYFYLYGNGCQRCPLSDGSLDAITGYTSGCCDNAYHRVLNARMRKTKLQACDEIIATLKGEIHGKRKSASGNGRSIRRNDAEN